MVHEIDLCMGINESKLIFFLVVALPSAPSVACLGPDAPRYGCIFPGKRRVKHCKAREQVLLRIAAQSPQCIECAEILAPSTMLVLIARTRYSRGSSKCVGQPNVVD